MPPPCLPQAESYIWYSPPPTHSRSRPRRCVHAGEEEQARRRASRRWRPQAARVTRLCNNIRLKREKNKASERRKRHLDETWQSGK